MKKLLLTLLTIATLTTVSAQTIIPQGGTGLSTSTPGDLLVGTSSIRYSRLPIGSSGTVLQASSTSPFRMAWVTLSSIFDSLLSSNNTWTGTNNFTATTTLGVVNITGNLAVDTNTLYVDSTNNRVGIGTTSPANKLHVYEATAATPVRLSLNNAVTGATANDGLALAVDEVGDAFVIQREAANLKLYTNNTVTNGILINSSGKVGIGTSSPTAKLDIWGDLNVGTSSTPTLFVNTGTGSIGIGTTSATAALTLGGTQAGIVIDRTANDSYLQLSSSGVSGGQLRYFAQNMLSFADNNGTDRIVFDTSTGNVGIGTTSPTNKLQVVGSVAVRETDDGALAGRIFAGVSSGQLELYGSGSLTTLISGSSGGSSYFNNGGNVGIGTTTPNSVLTIASSTTSTSASILNIFNSLSTPIMRILGSGAVLFGTTTTANCGNAPCGLTVATTTQFTAGVIARVVGYSSAASTTINLNTTDIATTTIDRATTFVNPTGTAYDGAMFEIRARATTTQTVYWDTVFASSTDLTNVSSVASGTTRFLFEYRQDVGKWELVGKLGQYIN